MARVEIPVHTLDRVGVTPPTQTISDATNLHVFVNNGQTFLEIVSIDAGSQHCDFTITSTSNTDGVTVPPKIITVAAGATVLVGPWPTNIYNQTSVYATGLLTSDGTAPSNNDTVTIGTQVYTFKTTLTPTAYEVHIGGSAAAALVNLGEAINAGANSGTDYAAGLAANLVASAGTPTSTTLLLTARQAGDSGNAIATTETSSHLSFGAATLVGGFSTGTVFMAPSVSTNLKFRAYSLA